jgi:hypothetical protein
MKKRSLSSAKEMESNGSRIWVAEFTRLYIQFDKEQIRGNYRKPSMVPGLHMPVQAAWDSSKLPPSHEF